MDLFYWKSPQGNFGDDLNEWIWDSLLPGWRGWERAVTLVGVGTIFNDVHFPDDRPGQFLILGSGVGYGAPPKDERARRFDIRSLRGPRSAQSLNLPESTGIVDPAMMIATLDAFKFVRPTGRPIFVPHVSSVDRHPWEQICAQIGVDYVSPSGDAQTVIRKIAGASLVIAESLHAAILADAFRVPWRAVSLTESFNREKWLDWGGSLQLVPEVRSLVPAVDRLLAVRNRAGLACAPKPPGSAGFGVDRKPSFKRRLRFMLERALIPQALKAQLTLPPQLSSFALLQQRRDQYSEVLRGVIRDYS